MKQVKSNFFHPISVFSVSGQLGRIPLAQIPPLLTGTLIETCFFESCYMSKKRLTLQAFSSKTETSLSLSFELAQKYCHITLLKLNFHSSNNHPHGLSIFVIFVFNLFKVVYIYDYQSYRAVTNQFRRSLPNFL